MHIDFCVLLVNNHPAEEESSGCFTESENIINLLLVSQVIIKSKARSTALASAVKVNEPPGIRCIWQWLSDVTAHASFESFDPSV